LIRSSATQFLARRSSPTEFTYFIASPNLLQVFHTFIQ
jgi:hypothetical protein